MYSKIKILFQNNHDLTDFFIKNLKEKYLLDIILDYATTDYTQEYIEWRKNLPENKNICEKFVREHKLAIHAAKYNKKVMRSMEPLRRLVEQSNVNLLNGLDDTNLRTYMEYTYISNNHTIICDKQTDILNCISFRKYKPGSIFHFKIGGQWTGTVTLTKENRYDLFSPILNKLPVYMICCSYHDIQIQSPNTLLNKPVYFYGTFLNSSHRRELCQSTCTNTNIYLPINDNGGKISYQSGCFGISLN
jgi:hypothetical protein